MEEYKLTRTSRFKSLSIRDDCAHCSLSMRRKWSCKFREWSFNWLTSRWNSAIVRCCDSIVSAWRAIYDAELVFAYSRHTIGDDARTVNSTCPSYRSITSVNKCRHANGWVEGRTAALASAAACFDSWAPRVAACIVRCCDSIVSAWRAIYDAELIFAWHKIGDVARTVNSTWPSYQSTTSVN
jgi:hypothetical protein